MRMIAIASACLLAGLLLAGCNRAGWDWGGRWSPKMATSSGGASPGEAPGGEVSPVIAADAPVAKTKESAPPPAVPHPPPAREGKYEARLDGVDLPVASKRPPVLTPAGDGTPQLVNTVLAEVNGEVITREDILGPLRPQMAKWQRELSPEAFESQCRQVVDMRLREAVSRRLVLQEAKADLSDKDKEEIEAQVNAVVKNLSAEAGSMHQLEQQVRADGSTLEEEKTRHRERLMVQRYLREKVAPAVHVTHGELLALYNQVRRERYEQPLRVRLGLITIRKSQSDQAQALGQVVRQRAAAGEDFARLAERYSHDPMASNGGDWGLVTQGALKEKAVEGALFGLAAGEVSPVVETADAFCIVKALERQEARTVPFTEVQGALEDEIRDRKYNEMVSKYIQQLYGRSYVRVMLDNL